MAVGEMKSLGMNAFRTNSWPTPELLLDLADEMGIMVQSEAPAIALRGGWDPACPSHIYEPSGHHLQNLAEVLTVT